MQNRNDNYSDNNRRGFGVCWEGLTYIPSSAPLLVLPHYCLIGEWWKRCQVEKSREGWRAAWNRQSYFPHPDDSETPGWLKRFLQPICQDNFRIGKGYGVRTAYRTSWALAPAYLGNLQQYLPPLESRKLTSQTTLKS